jgi:hypothetical protein
MSLELMHYLLGLLVLLTGDYGSIAIYVCLHERPNIHLKPLCKNNNIDSKKELQRQKEAEVSNIHDETEWSL